MMSIAIEVLPKAKKVDKETGEVLEFEKIPVVPEIIRRPRHRFRLSFATVGESRTSQSSADLCDINKIVAKYDRTGELPPGRGPGQYGDVTALQGDMTEMINKSRENIEKVSGVLKERKRKAREEQLDLIEEGKRSRADKAQAEADVNPNSD